MYTINSTLEEQIKLVFKY